jgi:hypothetical protein
MRRGPRARAILVAIGMTGAILVTSAPPAQAVFHLMKVREVFAGTAEQPAAQFVELQMYSAGQSVVTGHDVTVFDAVGDEVGSFTFTQPVDNSDDNAYILVATTEAEATFGVTADLTMTPVIAAAGGKVCFADDIDCASWGSYSGDKEGTGTPFNGTTGLVPGQSMERKISGGEEADNLDAGDDTDDSAADFQSASPSPTSNTGGEEPPPEEGAEHARSMTLTLKRHLKASGTVTSEDDTAACAADVEVRIQRKAKGAWRTVGSTTTDETGNYKVKVSDKPGKYRALAPEVEPNDSDKCLEAKSSPRTHKH